MRAYKVARKMNNSDTYISAFDGDGAVEYVIGRKTIPKDKCGPLCVFDTFENASIFERNMKFIGKKVVILECEIEESDEDIVYELDSAEKFYKEYFPIGTLLASSVTAIKEVTCAPTK